MAKVVNLDVETTPKKVINLDEEYTPKKIVIEEDMEEELPTIPLPTKKAYNQWFLDLVAPTKVSEKRGVGALEFGGNVIKNTADFAVTLPKAILWDLPKAIITSAYNDVANIGVLGGKVVEGKASIFDLPVINYIPQIEKMFGKEYFTTKEQQEDLNYGLPMIGAAIIKNYSDKYIGNSMEETWNKFQKEAFERPVDVFFDITTPLALMGAGAVKTAAAMRKGATVSPELSKLAIAADYVDNLAMMPLNAIGKAVPAVTRATVRGIGAASGAMTDIAYNAAEKLKDKFNGRAILETGDDVVKLQKESLARSIGDTIQIPKYKQYADAFEGVYDNILEGLKKQSERFGKLWPVLRSFEDNKNKVTKGIKDEIVLFTFNMGATDAERSQKFKEAADFVNLVEVVDGKFVPAKDRLSIVSKKYGVLNVGKGDARIWKDKKNGRSIQSKTSQEYNKIMSNKNLTYAEKDAAVKALFEEATTKAQGNKRGVTQDEINRLYEGLNDGQREWVDVFTGKSKREVHPYQELGYDIDFMNRTALGEAKQVYSAYDEIANTLRVSVESKVDDLIKRVEETTGERLSFDDIEKAGKQADEILAKHLEESDADKKILSELDKKISAAEERISTNTEKLDDIDETVYVNKDDFIRDKRTLETNITKAKNKLVKYKQKVDTTVNKILEEKGKTDVVIERLRKIRAVSKDRVNTINNRKVVADIHGNKDNHIIEGYIRLLGKDETPKLDTLYRRAKDPIKLTKDIYRRLETGRLPQNLDDFKSAITDPIVTHIQNQAAKAIVNELESNTFKLKNVQTKVEEDIPYVLRSKEGEKTDTLSNGAEINKNSDTYYDDVHDTKYHKHNIGTSERPNYIWVNEDVFDRVSKLNLGGKPAITALLGKSFINKFNATLLANPMSIAQNVFSEASSFVGNALRMAMSGDLNGVYGLTKGFKTFFTDKPKSLFFRAKENYGDFFESTRDLGERIKEIGIKENNSFKEMAGKTISLSNAMADYAYKVYGYMDVFVQHLATSATLESLYKDMGYKSADDLWNAIEPELSKSVDKQNLEMIGKVTEANRANNFYHFNYGDPAIWLDKLKKNANLDNTSVLQALLKSGQFVFASYPAMLINNNMNILSIIFKGTDLAGKKYASNQRLAYLASFALTQQMGAELTRNGMTLGNSLATQIGSGIVAAHAAGEKDTDEYYSRASSELAKRMAASIRFNFNMMQSISDDFASAPVSEVSTLLNTIGNPFSIAFPTVDYLTSVYNGEKTSLAKKFFEATGVVPERKAKKEFVWNQKFIDPVMADQFKKDNTSYQELLRQLNSTENIEDKLFNDPEDLYEDE